MTTLVLQLDQVRKVYPASPPVESLRGVDLCIHSGELVAIVGPSGSGKTTLLNLAAGLDRPTTGSVRIAGHPVEKLSDRRLSGLRAHHLGVVFQQFFLLDHLSAMDNVATGLLYRGTPAAARRRAAITALQRVGLAHRIHHSAQKLSGGERQRVALGRALLSKPRLLLLDEPLGSLDEGRKVEILPYLVRLRDEGIPMVYVSHDAAELRQLATQIVMLRNGQVTALGGVKVLSGAPSPN
jgi:putative ABC transport system ATP-binding protein